MHLGVVDAQVVISLGGETIGTHAIRHERSKEQGALANPNGRLRKPATAA